MRGHVIVESNCLEVVLLLNQKTDLIEVTFVVEDVRSLAINCGEVSFTLTCVVLMDYHIPLLISLRRFAGFPNSSPSDYVE